MILDKFGKPIAKKTVGFKPQDRVPDDLTEHDKEIVRETMDAIGEMLGIQFVEADSDDIHIAPQDPSEE